MTVYKGALLIFNGADRTNINKVGAALGRGPETFTRKLTETNPPVWDSTVSGWYAFQAGSEEVFSMWADLVGTLPVYDDEDNEIVWSEYGLTSVQATAALADLHVFGYSSTQALDDFIAATAAQMDPVQYRVPDPEP